MLTLCIPRAALLCASCDRVYLRVLPCFYKIVQYVSCDFEILFCCNSAAKQSVSVFLTV